ncbi:MAG: hypothetical protein AAFX99_20785, partial [Myxococcota bacterium]
PAPTDEPEPNSEPPSEPDDTPAPHYLVLPEEMRPPIWRINRQVQEFALQDQLTTFGGWKPRPATHGPGLTHEPLDRLKALICVLEERPIVVSGKPPKPRPDDTQYLNGLECATAQPMACWDSIIELALLNQTLTTRNHRTNRPRELSLARRGSEHLDQGTSSWSRDTLSRWVQGTGPRQLDHAQNVAFGLSQEWLDEIRSVLGSHRNVPAVETRWIFDDFHLPPERLRQPEARFRRPTPTWLSTHGYRGEDDIWCGTPRSWADREALTLEIHLIEGIMLTFRLLLLDLLGGFNATQHLTIQTLRPLCQETAALAVHLNLTTILADILGQTFVPLRPPTYLIEPMSDEGFEQFAVELVERLLAPAGALEFQHDRHTFRLLPWRIVVPTPRWFDHNARLNALSHITEVEIKQIETAYARNPSPLRSVTRSHTESERRVWLGRPIEELRLAAAGRHVTALSEGYLELA